MARIQLFEGEDILDTLNANYGTSGGKLYLTNKRVLYVTNFGRNEYSIELTDIESCFSKPAMGMYLDVCIKGSGSIKIFRAFKKGGTSFSNKVNEAVGNLETSKGSYDTINRFDDKEKTINNNQQDSTTSNEESVRKKVGRSETMANEQKQNKTKEIKKGGVVIVTVVILLVFFMIGLISGLNDVGVDNANNANDGDVYNANEANDDIVGKYRNGIEYLTINSDGTATVEYRGIVGEYTWEKVEDGYYTFDTGKMKLDVEYYGASGCVTVNYATMPKSYYSVEYNY